MKCSRCQQENQPQAKFCLECATPLAQGCANCGTQLAPSAKFCSECATPVSGLSPTTPRFVSPHAYTPKHLAERIISSKAALEGERKQVTVLFADLKSSMELVADRDPEEGRKILDSVLERMMAAVHRFEGTVNNVLGDGIMSLFGAPIAHEDHAVRACYAALRMQELVKRYAEDARRVHGVNVQIRVGLNSGEVVVRSIGSDLHMDYAAVGQTTHLAARMEQLATPGSILLTSSTLELVEGFVAVKALGPVPVKGLAEAVEVYEMTGIGPARTRLQASVRRGLTRFVGRDAELEQLRRAQQLADNGHGQVAAIVGEAGVGKSRLVYEFIHSHRMQGWLTLESTSVSYGKATSYLPVIDLLKDYFRIQDRDDLREIREKVTGKLFTLDRGLEPTLLPLLALLDVPVDDAAWQTIDPAQRRQRMLDAAKRLLLREAREQPLLLIFEDLHWIDTETQALLDGLVDSLGSARLLLLVNYRPGYQHTWASKTYYSQMRLDALPAESAGDLLKALLGDDRGLAPLKQMLVKRGNPFFLEEIVRTLVETKALVGDRGRYRLTQPVQAIQVPATVQTVLAARIDRLSLDDKRLLQTTSVVGRDVPFALLQAIADLPEEVLRRGLDQLQAAEFLHETGLYPDLEYSFKHALTRDVTYGGLLHERRRELHARLVEAIETLHTDRLGEQIERLAHHALRGDLPEKAVLYLRQAGIKASARSALTDARAWFEQALGVLEALPETRSTLEQGFEIRIELGSVLTQLGDHRAPLELLRVAETLAEKLRDDRRRGRVCALMTSSHTLVGELDEALVTGDRALAIAERLGDVRVRVLATSFLEQLHFFRGEYGRVVELATKNLATLRADWVHEYFGQSIPASIYDRCWLVRGLAELGRFAETEVYEAEAIRLAEATHHAWIIGWTHLHVGLVHLHRGDWAKACSLIERARAVLQTGNVVLHLAQTVAVSAWILAQLGDANEALSRLREGEQLAQRHAATGGAASRSYQALSRAHLLLGRLDEARRLGGRAVELAAGYGSEVDAVHLLGDIETHPDRIDAGGGDAYYRRALAHAGPRGMRPLVAHCHLGLGKFYRQTGKLQEAQEHLVTATTMYREMEMTYWLEKTQKEVAKMQ